MNSSVFAVTIVLSLLEYLSLNMILQYLLRRVPVG